MSDTQKHTKPNVPNLRFPGFSEDWGQKPLSSVVTLRKSRINSENVADEDYISTENMLPNFGGVSAGNSKPKTGNVIEYSMGDTLISNIRPYLKKVWFADRDGGCSTDVIVLKAKQNLDKLFLYHSLANERFINHTMAGAKGVKMPRGDREQMLEFPIGLPSINEQLVIAKFLSLIDKRIAIQNKVIEKYESLIKALRHHIFSALEPEKEVRIADILSYEQPTKYIVSDTEYSDNKDLTPVLTANKAFVLGYTEEIEGVYDKGPCIILDDFTLDSKIVDFPFKVKSTAIKILSPKASVNLRFVFEYLKYLDLNTEEHKRHYIAEIEPMTIELPEEGTIQSITNLFDRIDSRRKGLERDLQLLESQKNYLLSALFI